MRKGIVVLISLFLLTLPLPLQACQPASASNYDVLSMDVRPIKVVVDEKFSVTASINNNTKSEASYTVPVMVNGIADDRTTVTLAPGKSQEIRFTLHRSTPGTYEIRIGDKITSITVVEYVAPAFTLSDLKLNMEQANPGEEVVIVAKLSNTGGSEGTYIAELKVNNTVEQSDKVTMAPGVNYFLAFKLTKKDPGTYNIAIGDLTGKFTVLEPIQTIQVTQPTCPPGSKGSSCCP